MCEHDKIRIYCPHCNGSAICKSRLEPYSTGSRTYGNRKLNCLCSHCFVNLFPDDPRALNVRKKSKELEVVSYSSNSYEGLVMTSRSM